MDTLAAGEERKTDQAQVGHQVADAPRGIAHRGEIEPDIGVEVEHQPVGLFERLDP